MKLSEFEGMRLVYTWKDFPMFFRNTSPVSSPEDVVNFADGLQLLENDTEDAWYGFFCNTAQKILGYKKLFPDKQNKLVDKEIPVGAVSAIIKDLYRTAVAIEAKATFLLHVEAVSSARVEQDWPDTSKTKISAYPTLSDNALADKIKDFSILLGIRVVDFIVVTKNKSTTDKDFYSFRQSSAIPI